MQQYRANCSPLLHVKSRHREASCDMVRLDTDVLHLIGLAIEEPSVSDEDRIATERLSRSVRALSTEEFEQLVHCIVAVLMLRRDAARDAIVLVEHVRR